MYASSVHKAAKVVVATISMGFCLAAASAASEPVPDDVSSYPERPLSFLVGAAPGGNTDFWARALADPLGRALGQSIVVENRSGASGSIAASAVSRAKPDGYTFLFQYNAYHIINPQLNPGLPWDPFKDFAPVAHVISAPQVIVVRADLPIHSLKDLVDYDKNNPGKLNYASAGNGSILHISGEMLNQMAHTRFTHIPYSGAGPAFNDLLGGTVDFMITTLPPMIGHIEAGKLRPLAVTNRQRLAKLPDVPTTAEAGYPDLVVSSWLALYAPKETPRPVIAKLASEIEKVMKTDEFRTRAESTGTEALFMGPEELGEYTLSEFERWGSVLKDAGLLQAK